MGKTYTMIAVYTTTYTTSTNVEITEFDDYNKAMTVMQKIKSDSDLKFLDGFPKIIEKQFDITIRKKVNSGYLIADTRTDTEFQGIEVEYENENTKRLVNPRVLTECECDSDTNNARVIIWDNPYSEDYMQIIKLNS